MAEQCGRFGVPQLGPKINPKQGGRLGAPQLDPKINTFKKKCHLTNEKNVTNKLVRQGPLESLNKTNIILIGYLKGLG